MCHVAHQHGCECGPLGGQKMNNTHIWIGCVDGGNYATKIMTKWTSSDKGPQLSEHRALAKHNSQVGLDVYPTSVNVYSLYITDFILPHKFDIYQSLEIAL